MSYDRHRSRNSSPAQHPPSSSLGYSGDGRFTNSPPSYSSPTFPGELRSITYPSYGEPRPPGDREGSPRSRRGGEICPDGQYSPSRRSLDHSWSRDGYHGSPSRPQSGSSTLRYVTNPEEDDLGVPGDGSQVRQRFDPSNPDHILAHLQRQIDDQRDHSNSRGSIEAYESSGRGSPSQGRPHGPVHSHSMSEVPQGGQSVPLDELAKYRRYRDDTTPTSSRGSSRARARANSQDQPYDYRSSSPRAFEDQHERQGGSGSPLSISNPDERFRRGDPRGVTRRLASVTDSTSLMTRGPLCMDRRGQDPGSYAADQGQDPYRPHDRPSTRSRIRTVDALESSSPALLFGLENQDLQTCTLRDLITYVGSAQRLLYDQPNKSRELRAKIKTMDEDFSRVVWDENLPEDIERETLITLFDDMMGHVQARDVVWTDRYGSQDQIGRARTWPRSASDLGERGMYQSPDLYDVD